MIEIEAGSTTIRWKLSRCMPSASARIALIGSPCETAAQTASGAVLGRELGVPGPDRRRPPGRTSPPSTPRRETGPPTAAAAPSPRACPCSARAATCRSTRRSRTRPGPARPPPDSRRPGRATSAWAVCRQRRSGEVTIARSGTPAIRAAHLGACSVPGRVQLDAGGTPGQDARRCWPRYVRGGSAAQWSSADEAIEPATVGSGRGRRPGQLRRPARAELDVLDRPRTSRPQPACSGAAEAGRRASRCVGQHRTPVVSPTAEGERPARRRGHPGEGVGQLPRAASRAGSP